MGGDLGRGVGGGVPEPLGGPHPPAEHLAENLSPILVENLAEIVAGDKSIEERHKNWSARIFRKIFR